MDYISIANQFDIEGEVISAVPFGNGLINSTILVTTDADRYILQQINVAVFKNPHKLTENIVMVTDHLRKRIADMGGDASRGTLTPIKAKNGGFLIENWRTYRYIDGCVCLEKVENAEAFYQTGKAFGHFQLMLSDFPADRLFEVIPHFHDTPHRFADFEQAVENGIIQRVDETRQLIDFLLARKDDGGIIMNALASGGIPLRVTHNDTKINNIMLDADTFEGVCVIDLDTVMPGSALFDMGDALRTGANNAAEDEADLSKPGVNTEFFGAFVRGFIEGMEGSLTKKEKALIVRGFWTLTLEQTVRFLTDYLNGDTYFKVNYDGHNLVRTRSQAALLMDIESKWDELEAIVAEIE